MAALAAVDPERATQRALRSPASSLRGHGVTLFAFGKAARGLARGALRCVDVDRGVLIDAIGAPLPPLWTARGGHPYPAADAEQTGAEVLALAQSLGAADVALVLLSGGGSSMLELPAPGWSIDAIRTRTEALMRAGAPIDVLNAARVEMSRFKGGGLTTALRPARVVACVVSDVPGHPASLVASDPCRGADELHLVASAETALDAAIAAAAARGLRFVPFPRIISGEARVEGPRFARDAAELARAQNADGCVACGETTVTVRGQGRGGRNQEAALACLIEGEPRQGELVMLATDGVDGASDAAGAHLTPELVARADAHQLQRALDDNDSFTALDALGATLRLGPTGTNVADLWISSRV